MKAYPPFYIQLSDGNGTIVRSRFGKHERLLVDSIVEKTLTKGVGVMVTQAQVEARLRAAIEEVINELRLENPFDVIE